MQFFETILHLFHPRRSNNHRAKLLHPDNIFSIALILIGFGLAINNLSFVSKDLGGILGYASNISVQQVVSLTNTERAKNGLGSVSLNDQLSSAAHAKATDMFAAQYWAHVSPTGKQPWDFMKEASYRFSAAGENLARDFSTTPEMIEAWMGSPSHRANLMNGQYNEIGVAVVNGTLQGIETTLVVQMFGRQPTAAAGSGSNASTQAVTREAATTVVPEEVTRQLEAQDKQQTQVTTAGTVLPSQNEGGESVTPPAVPRGTAQEQTNEVLAQAVVPTGTIQPEKISPLELMKPFFLGILILVILTLAYDAQMFERKNTVRVVGKNLGHILFLATVSTIVVLFKAGAIQ